MTAPKYITSAVWSNTGNDVVGLSKHHSATIYINTDSYLEHHTVLIKPMGTFHIRMVSFINMQIVL